MSRHIIGVLLSALVLLGAALLASVGHAQTIKDPAGNVWLARGLNIFDGQMVSGNASVAHVQALFPHLNFVRLAIGENNCTDLSITNCNQPISSIETGISTFTAKGIVMMVDPHVGGGGQDASGINLYNEARFLGQIAADKKNDPYVWIESANEMNAAGLTQEHVNVYNAARNAGAPWAASTGYANHVLRNKGGNLYIQTAGPTGVTANACTSGTSGPTGTGTGIVDASCRWDFVSVYTAAAAGGSNAVVVFCVPNGNPNSPPNGPLSAYAPMVNIAIDQHWYDWMPNNNQPVTSQAMADTAYTNAVAFDESTYATTAGTPAVIAGETGYIDYVGSDPNNCINCNGSYFTVNAPMRMVAGSGFAQWLWHWDTGQPSTDATAQDGLSRTGNGNNTNTVGIAPGPAPSPVGGSGVNAAVNWGGGGDTDIRAACSDIGAAVAAVNPGVILFCPAPLNNAAALLNGGSKP